MSSATTLHLKYLECCYFTTSISKPTSPSLPLKQIHFSPIPISLRTKFSPFNIVPLVAQTSDWAQQQVREEVEEEANSEADNESGEAIEANNATDSFAWEGKEEVAASEAGGDSEVFHSQPPAEPLLYVGNLPYDVDSETLALLFDQAGIVEIAEVKYNRITDASRGFAFVTMRTMEEAENALKMFNGYDLNGRMLIVRKAAPRGSRPEKRNNEIFIGNLPYQVDGARLEQIFSKHGNVVKATVVYDRKTARSRGFGFITMSSETEVTNAIAALDGRDLDGQAVRVSLAFRPRFHRARTHGDQEDV